MNKSTHIILYIVLFTSVIALYFLQFKTAENNSPKSKDSDSNPTIDSNNMINDLPNIINIFQIRFNKKMIQNSIFRGNILKYRLIR